MLDGPLLIEPYIVNSDPGIPVGIPGYYFVDLNEKIKCTTENSDVALQ